MSHAWTTSGVTRATVALWSSCSRWRIGVSTVVCSTESGSMPAASAASATGELVVDQALAGYKTRAVAWGPAPVTWKTCLMNMMVFPDEVGVDATAL